MPDGCVPAFGFFIVFASVTYAFAGTKQNVLFIVADDMRPALGVYGEKDGGGKFHTPNLDNLAARGVVFRNAFAQQALCGPSRTSFLTGRRPDTLRTLDNRHAYWREFAGNFTTIPQYFKQNGYHTVSAGKIFHPGKLSNHTDDYPLSWSEKPFHPSTEKYKQAKVCPSADGALKSNVVCPVHVEDQPEKSLPDIQTAMFAIDFLQKRKYNNSVPFFLAVGLHKPHIPLKYPHEFKQMYPLENISVADNWQIPEGLPDVAWNPWSDLRRRDDVAALNVSFPYGPLPFHYQKLLKQSYYASVSYIDVLVGTMLLALRTSGLHNDTIVIFTSDHGWSLGEHGEWAKYSNFGVALRVPLIVYIPGIQPSSNSIDALVELVDLFPSMANMANLTSLLWCPENSSSVQLCAEGQSFMPLIKDKQSKGKSAIFAQFPRPSVLPQMNSDEPRFRDIRVMGYTMRTEQYHYTEWVGVDVKRNVRNWTDVKARELYVLKEDPKENRNMANDPQYSNLAEELSKSLHEGWRKQRRY